MIGNDEDGVYSMSSRHRTVINQCRVFLVQNLSVKPVLDEFISSGLINSHTEESLNVYSTNAEFVRNFCTTLTRLGPNAFQAFLDALDATDQSNVREFIESKLCADQSQSSDGGRAPREIYMSEEQQDNRPTKTDADVKDMNKSPESYRMRGGKHVNVLVINNQTFQSSSLDERTGSCVDLENLKKLFGDVLKFNVDIQQELQRNDMAKIIREYSQKEFHADADACIVVVMSHGENGVIYGIDEETISVGELMSYFSADRCKHLKEKPKYFIFQSCRGTYKESGVDATDAGAQFSVPSGEHPLALPSQQRFIPAMADFLVSYATIPGFVSWRNSEKGSWFIQSLCSVFENYSSKYDVLTMTTMITGDLVKLHGVDYKQLCEHKSHLRRRFCLTPSAV